MKVNMKTSIVSITIIIICFLTLIYFIAIQFVYAQSVENEIIGNPLEGIEKITASNLEIADSLNKSSESTDRINISDKSVSHSQNEFKNNSRNWINGESDKLSFKYPSNWDVDISDSRFDNYEFIFTDKASNSSIQVSDEALSPGNKILHGTNLERYFSIYMLEHSPLSSDSNKIDTYSKGKISIAGLPAYSELYLDQGYAILVSLAFQEGSDRHYTVIAKSPSSNYESLEPIMLEIIKLITPKTIEKPLELQVETPFNNTNSVDLGNTKDIQQLQKEGPISNESLATKQQPQDTSIKEALEQTFGKENTIKLENQTVVVNDTKIEQEEEQLKPISDDMLEYAEEILPTLSNPNLSRDDKVKILNQQFTDPELFLKNWKSLEYSIDSLDDPIERELPLSNAIQSNNTSNQSQTIEQTQQQQENDSSIQTSNIYEGMGIKINYLDPWEMNIQSDDPSCLFMYSIMLSTPNLEATIIIFQDKFDGPEIKNKCKCDTLLEYVKYIYKDKISKQDDFVFIDDNQTTLTDGIPAIQMEYEKKGLSTNFENVETKNIIKNSYEILTKGPNSFYRLIFSADKIEQYPKYIKDFKKMLNSLEFISTNSDTINKPKQPSFMASEESN